MFVSFISDKKRNNSNNRTYALEHVARHNGWFISGNAPGSLFNIQFSDSSPGNYSIETGQSFNLSLPENELKTIIDRLACRDSHSPDAEPPPLDSPLMDGLLQAWQTKLIDLSRKHKRIYLYKMPWPEGKRFALVITHDIDLTRKYGVKSLLKDTFSLRKARFNEHFNMSVFGQNIYWNFGDLLRFYENRKLKSSFFFIAKKWEKTQYRYNIRQQKFKKLFEDIISQNHEIGLHSSRFCFDSPTSTEREKGKLEKVLGHQITGVRQHYLRLMFPQAWKNFEQAGFLYDSSCGYNNSVGFRAGTSLPFRTYDYELEVENNLFEIPFSIMDYSWKELSRNELQQQEIFENVISRIEATHGLIHILWHPSNLAEPVFQPYWNRLINWMEHEDFYNASLYQLLEWRAKRSEVTCPSFRDSPDAMEFVLHSGNSLQNLCLGIVSPRQLQQSDMLQELSARDEYRLQIPEMTTGEHTFRLMYEK